VTSKLIEESGRQTTQDKQQHMQQYKQSLKAAEREENEDGMDIDNEVKSKASKPQKVGPKRVEDFSSMKGVLD